jgi:CheY-like chemotaxis protein
MNDPIPTVLHVEDDRNDRLLLATTFRNTRIAVNLQAAEDGEKTVDYLTGNGVYADREHYPFPKLVVLDLKLPRKSGFEVLSWIRSQDKLKNLPVVVLSSSEHEAEMQEAIHLGASGYYAKPVSVVSLKELIKEISSKWLAWRGEVRRVPEF